MGGFDDIVQDAMDEAERFILKAAAYLVRSENDRHAKYGCVESASMVRASMDLTRALVEVRKTRH